MNVLGKYKNGNYTVTILEDGTKIRENDLDHFRADSPESMDIKITNCCDMGCPMCHENSTKDGKHGNIMDLEFIDKLHPYTELAIGGGNPLAHPDLIPFLEKCKKLKLIPSMTVNQVHFMKDQELIKRLVDEKLIYGLGVSLTSVTPKFVAAVQQYPNVVIHVIAGLVSISQLSQLRELSNSGLKILILGYKQFRRGEILYATNSSQIDSEIEELRKMLPLILNNGWFEVISFDNLAIKQLNPKRFLSKKQWEEFFMGEDGFATMYVDCVNEEFARSSTSTERYPITNDIVDMFNIIRS